MIHRTFLVAACAAVLAACGPSTTEETPPDFNAVSNATQCLPNGTVHDPNPPGCQREDNCQYTPRADTNDWSNKLYKKQCAETDWMTGVSTGPDRRINSFRCEMSPYTYKGASAYIGKNQNENRDPQSYPVSDASTNFDWDPGFQRAECPANKFVSGISFTTGSRGTTVYTVGRIRCSRFYGANQVNNTNCRAVTFPANDLPQTSNRESMLSGEWDPAPNLMLECGTGSHMAGVSIANDTIHGILCCDGGPDFNPTNSATCCNENTYNAALNRCLQDANKYLSSCNLVDYCCQPGVSSFAGSASCEAAAYAEDPSTEGGTGLSVGPSSVPTTPSTASGGSSFIAEISGIRGNNGFGGGYDAIVSLSATKAPLDAKAEGKVIASATLFGGKINLATVSVKGSAGAQKATANMKFLGLDVDPFPLERAGASVSVSESKSQTFFSQSRTFTVGPVPVTVAGSIYGVVGIGATLEFVNSQLSLTGGPSGTFSVTASASLGGSMPGFQLTAGVEGTMALFRAAVVGSIVLTPTLTNLTYNVDTGLKVQELDGKLNLKMQAKLVTFKKTYTRKLVGFTAAEQTKPFYKYTNAVTW